MAALAPQPAPQTCSVCGQPTLEESLCDDCWWSLHEEDEQTAPAQPQKDTTNDKDQETKDQANRLNPSGKG